MKFTMFSDNIFVKEDKGNKGDGMEVEMFIGELPARQA